MIPHDAYLDFVDSHYLAEFIQSGGAAVKFVISRDDATADAFRTGLRARSVGGGYLHVSVDAVSTRVHMIDQVFFAVARQIDWDALAVRFLRGALRDLGVEVGEDSDDVTLASAAARHDLDVVELMREARRLLQDRIVRDFTMAHEFRIAMKRLCQHQLATGDVTEDEHAAILDWLTGRLSRIGQLRTALIFRRIARHNARLILLSAARWVKRAGLSGVVLDVDIRRLALARRPPVDEQEGFYYSKAATIDAYEVLRQLIDATDELQGVCCIVTASSDFLSDEARGVATYHALHLRISDEVRDRQRDNPFASLIRLEGAA